MNTRSRITISRKPAMLSSLLVVLAMILAACQSSATPTNTQVPAAPAPTATLATAATGTPAAVVEPTIMVASNPTLGQILVDGKGMTLYMFTKDKNNVSNCSGSCLVKWPPLLTNGHPKAGDGVDGAMLGAQLEPRAHGYYWYHGRCWRRWRDGSYHRVRNYHCDY